MTVNLTKKIKRLNVNGYVILENILNKNQTDNIKIKLNKILKKRISNKEVVGDKESQVMFNYFYEDKSLLNLICFPQVDFILKNVLEPNYVLQSTNAQNRLVNIIKKNHKKSFKVGATWHTDSRYLNNKRLDKGFSYIVIVALDAFTKFNGPTKFIENSFKRREVPKRELNIPYKELLLPEGSVCIMDSGMWHKGGDSSSSSRWSIFSIYTGWFVKPYHNFQDFLLKNKIPKKYKKILHFYSQPPKINELRNTVKNV